MPLGTAGNHCAGAEQAAVRRCVDTLHAVGNMRACCQAMAPTAVGAVLVIGPNRTEALVQGLEF